MLGDIAGGRWGPGGLGVGRSGAEVVLTSRKESSQQEEADRKCCWGDAHRNRKPKEQVPPLLPPCGLPLVPCPGRAERGAAGRAEIDVQRLSPSVPEQRSAGQAGSWELRAHKPARCSFAPSEAWTQCSSAINPFWENNLESMSASSSQDCLKEPKCLRTPIPGPKQ